MLKFSKLNILTTTLLSILVIFFTISNFTTFDDEYLNKKINLGLDLQGGSYLLLKIDNDPVVIKELQNKAISIKTFFKEQRIKIFNIKVTDEKKIIFSINKKDIEKVNELLNDKDGTVNPYFDQFKSFQFDVTNQGENFNMLFSNYGLIRLKTSSLDQAIEIDICLWDERLSTVGAFNLSSQLDVNVSKREKNIDQNAAAFILQGAIDFLKN